MGPSQLPTKAIRRRKARPFLVADLPWRAARRFIPPVDLAAPSPLACLPFRRDTRPAAASRLPSTSDNSPRRPSAVAPNALATIRAAIQNGCCEEEPPRVASCLRSAVGASATASPAPYLTSRCLLDRRRSACHPAC